MAPLSDDEAMAIALGEAQKAFALGEVPVGAVVVHNGEIVAHGYNQREMNQDPCAHAEIVALRAAAQALGTWRLDEATLFVTLEPCPMCAGALINARFRRVVFGAADPKAGACGSLYNLCSDPRLNHEVEVVAGVGAQTASGLLRQFFNDRRG
jgi:tRNA(adenine34) deaminase